MTAKLIALLLLSSLLFTSLAHANLAQKFNDRFEVTTNKAGEMIIKDKRLFENVSLLNYLNHLGEFFDGSRNYVYVDEKKWNCKGAEYDIKSKAVRKFLKKVIKTMRKFKFQEIIVDKNFEKFLEKFDKMTKELIEREHVYTLANFDNSKYFFEKKIDQYIIKRLKDFIKDEIDIPGGVALALFLGNHYEKFIHKKRIYHQNILLSYLLASEDGELGLTPEQVDHALSSIFESRIRLDTWWYKGHRESKKAQKNWDGYGQLKMVKVRASAEKRWKKYGKKYFDHEEFRIDPVFSVAQYKGSDLVINLKDKKGRWAKRPSMAYDAECPEYNFEKRFGFEILDMGIKLFGLSVPGEVKKIYRKEYRSQIPTEGLLYGYLEMTNGEILSDIAKQAINPFIK